MNSNAWRTIGAVLVAVLAVAVVTQSGGGGGSTSSSSSSSSSSSTTVPPTNEPGQSWRLPTQPRGIFGCPGYRRDSVFHSLVEGLPVHQDSERWLNHMGADANVHISWGRESGMPINLADSSTQRRVVRYKYQYTDRTPSPVPIVANPRIEGWPDPRGKWDRKYVVVETDECSLHELWNADPLVRAATGQWWASSGARWMLDGSEGVTMRKGTTVSNFPLVGTIVRHEEIAAGVIDHLLWGCTNNASSTRFTWPSTNTDGPSISDDAPPMGARLRLRDGVADRFDGQARVVADAAERHGMIIGDTCGHRLGLMFDNIGTAWPGSWDQASIATLRNLRISDFDVVDVTPMIVSPGSWEVR